MCPNPFSGGSGGQAASTSTAQSAQSTTVNVSTPINIDTADLADALKALSGAQQQEAEAQLAGSLANAGATVQAAQIAAHAGPSIYVIGGAIVAVLGLLLTAGVVKVPRALRA
jgi:hypothetical protein